MTTLLIIIMYNNVYRKLSAKRKCHGTNVFLKADKALSKLNFPFHSKSIPNFLTLRKCNSHLQYYKIDLNFSIKLQESNLNVYKDRTERQNRTECVVQIFRSAKHNRIARPRHAQFCEKSRQVFLLEDM